MCDLCVQHGEGKKWYLQAKNHSRELLSEERKRGMTYVLGRHEEIFVDLQRTTDKSMSSDPAGTKAMFLSRVEEQKKDAWGQIVPLEDAEKVLDLCSSIVRFECICRRVHRGVHNARFCFGLNVVPEDFGPATEYPDFEELTREEAKTAFREYDREGMVHHVRSFGPFVWSMCNCDAADCLPLIGRARFDSTLAFYKAEYVSVIDRQACNGCRDCMKLCNFGAIRYSRAVEKCYVTQSQCFGCGVCRTVCPTNAVTLRGRTTIPALVSEW